LLYTRLVSIYFGDVLIALYYYRKLGPFVHAKSVFFLFLLANYLTYSQTFYMHLHAVFYGNCSIVKKPLFSLFHFLPSGSTCLSYALVLRPSLGPMHDTVRVCDVAL